jgi:hydrogenase nickel incorporation protein HypA/HybF
MHELAVTQNLLDLAIRHAEEAHSEKITDLYLVIGELSSFVGDAIQFYWDIIAQGTLAEGSKLHIRRIDAELQCLDCSARFHFNMETFICPECESTRLKIATGEEFLLEAIEVEP